MTNFKFKVGDLVAMTNLDNAYKKHHRQGLVDSDFMWGIIIRTQLVDEIQALYSLDAKIVYTASYVRGLHSFSDDSLWHDAYEL